MNSNKPMTLQDYWANPIPVRQSYLLHSAATQSSPRQDANSSTIIPINNDQNFEITLNKEKKKIPEQIQTSISEAAQKFNVPETLIQSVIKAESNFNPKAVSSVGAQGLMQLMPGTAKQLGVKNAFDIKQNIEGGTLYLKQMLDKFGGDVKKALAAYNAGPGNVNKYGGIPPFKETQNYVKKIMKDYENRQLSFSA